MASNGKIALAGDSAHAMLPHQGAGAGQAIEDAYVLAQLLNKPGLQKEDIPLVLQAYERLRLPRANAVQRTSREGGDLYEHAAEAVGNDPKEMKRLLEVRFALSSPSLLVLMSCTQSRMNWIWRYDIQGEVEKEMAASLSKL